MMAPVWLQEGIKVMSGRGEGVTPEMIQAAAEKAVYNIMKKESTTFEDLRNSLQRCEAMLISLNALGRSNPLKIQAERTYYELVVMLGLLNGEILSKKLPELPF